VYVGEAASPDAEMLPIPDFHRSPVLILEDDLETARIFENFLRDTEFQPILATSISQAEVWTARHCPVAVLADVYFGEDPSWEFMARLREKWPELPWISTSLFEQGTLARERGAGVFLLKPVEKGVLLEELRRMTARTGVRRILVVDDNEVSRYILRDLLNQPWLDIREAASGSQALMSIHENQPDGIILDLLMPDMGGLEVLRHLRKQHTTERLPVLIYTSKVLSQLEKAELEAWNVPVVRKEDITSRLSAEPFLDWARSVGLGPDGTRPEQDV
jgi:CheY-like chemotaxis protein